LSTWHHNDYRENEYVKSLWSKHSVITREHFYHVGGKEENRSPIIEALVTNFIATSVEKKIERPTQYMLFEKPAKYGVA
jgi:DNA adenine methylase